MKNILCLKKHSLYILIHVFIILSFILSFCFKSNQSIVSIAEIAKDNNSEVSRIIKIAIIDSGINLNNELKDKVVKSYNTINESSITSDTFNHGTPVGGIIAGNKIGVNPNAHLYDIQFIGEDGVGQLDDLVKGIEWAIEEDVDIINLSIGFQKSSSDLENVIEKANRNNIIVIAAAGNTYGFGVDYPAKYSNVLSIGSINKDLSKAYFSGEGKIDFVTLGTDLKSIDNKGNYDYFEGTSFSTAYFSGMISLIISKLPNKEDAYQFINHELKKYAYDLGPDGVDAKYGNGLIIIEKTE